MSNDIFNASELGKDLPQTSTIHSAANATSDQDSNRANDQSFDDDERIGNEPDLGELNGDEDLSRDQAKEPE